MKFDAIAIQRAQRNAYDTLALPSAKNGRQNPYYTMPKNITIPARLIQEQAYINTQNIFLFDFSQNAPAGTAANQLNNVRLGINQTAVVYGIQLLQGQGAAANNRIYRSRGLTVNDNSIYNSTVSIKFEVGTLVDLIPGQGFLEVNNTVTETFDENGLVLMNPQRVLTGRLGTFLVSITLNQPIAGLALTPNIFLSMRLHIALGQANA